MMNQVICIILKTFIGHDIFYERERVNKKRTFFWNSPLQTPINLLY